MKKFDLVLGNPPYQMPSSKGSRMLWNEICDKIIDITEDGGVIALVTPSSWIRCTTNNINSFKLFEKLQVEKAVVYKLLDTPFPGIGTTISYHITTNVPRHKAIPIYYGQWSKRSEEFAMDLDIINDKLWPADLSLINLGIHEKLNKFDKIQFTVSTEFNGGQLQESGKASDEQSDSHPYTYHVSPAITRYTNVKHSRHSEWRTMVAISSSLHNPIYGKDCGPGESVFCVYVEDEATAKNIYDMFRTDAYKFIGKLYKCGRNIRLKGEIPQVDYTRSWSSDELFDHFGFTEAEREYARSY